MELRTALWSWLSPPSHRSGLGPWRQTLFWHPQLFGKSSHSAAPSPKAYACPTNKPAALADMSPMTRMSAITLRLNPAPQILHSPK